MDIASEIANEVAGLKDRKGELFVYHKTGVNALVYLEMLKGAGVGSQQPGLLCFTSLNSLHACRTQGFRPSMVHC